MTNVSRLGLGTKKRRDSIEDISSYAKTHDKENVE
jgi:hypothetical protein